MTALLYDFLTQTQCTRLLMTMRFPYSYFKTNLYGNRYYIHITQTHVDQSRLTKLHQEQKFI